MPNLFHQSFPRSQDKGPEELLMCCGIYVNGICLNAWDLVKIEAGLLDFFFLWSLCNSPGYAGVGLLLLLFGVFLGEVGT